MVQHSKSAEKGGPSGRHPAAGLEARNSSFGRKLQLRECVCVCVCIREPVTTSPQAIELCDSNQSPRHFHNITERTVSESILMMSSPNCWRCLLRPSTAAPSSPASPRHMVLLPMSTIIPATSTTATATIPTSAAPFSTTARPQAAAGGHQRTGKRMSLSKFKKPKEIVRGKTPLPGERKAWRKRIVLSNNNAVPVHGAPRLDPESMVAPASAGRVFKVPEDTIDQLRASEAFKSSQTWGLFHSPHVLVRPETVNICGRMKEMSSKGETLRMVISGEKAAGKSMVLLQAMANAFLNGWIVINIPEGMISSSLPPIYRWMIM